MKNILVKVLQYSSRNKNRKELYRFCQIEYGRNADAVFHELRNTYDL